MRCSPTNSCACPLASVRTVWAFQTLWKRVGIGVPLGYSGTIRPRPRLRIRMLRLRFGLYLLGFIAAAFLVSGALGQSQGLSSWQPANISGGDRGMLAQVAAPAPRGTGMSRHGLRADDRVGRRGAVYQAGRGIVKFRAGVSTPARVNARSQGAGTAWRATLPTSA